jgi:hypothetical protein
MCLWSPHHRCAFTLSNRMLSFRSRTCLCFWCSRHCLDTRLHFSTWVSSGSGTTKHYRKEKDRTILHFTTEYFLSEMCSLMPPQHKSWMWNRSLQISQKSVRLVRSLIYFWWTFDSFVGVAVINPGGTPVFHIQIHGQVHMWSYFQFWQNCINWLIKRDISPKLGYATSKFICGLIFNFDRTASTDSSSAISRPSSAMQRPSSADRRPTPSPSKQAKRQQHPKPKKEHRQQPREPKPQQPKAKRQRDTTRNETRPARATRSTERPAYVSPLRMKPNGPDPSLVQGPSKDNLL